MKQQAPSTTQCLQNHQPNGAAGRRRPTVWIVACLAICAAFGATSIQPDQAAADRCSDLESQLARIDEEIANNQQLLAEARSRVDERINTMQLFRQLRAGNPHPATPEQRSDQIQLRQQQLGDTLRNIPHLNREVAALQQRRAAVEASYRAAGCGDPPPPGSCTAPAANRNPSTAPAGGSSARQRLQDRGISGIIVPISEQIPPLALIRGDGSLVDFFTGEPITPPGRAEQVRVPLGGSSGFRAGGVVNVDFYSVTAVDGSVATFARFVSSQGAISAGPPPAANTDPTPVTVDQSFPNSYFYIPAAAAGAVVMIRSIGSELPRLAPFLRQTIELLRQGIQVGAGATLLLLLSERERTGGSRCGYHFEFEVRSEGTDVRDASSPLAPSFGSALSRVRSSDAAEPPASTSEPGPTPTLTPPRTGSGPGIVHVVGSTCGTTQSLWTIRAFVGTESGAGFSYEFKLRPRLNRNRLITNGQVKLHPFEPGEFDPNNREGLRIWAAKKAAMRDQIEVSLADWGAKLTDRDGIGRGSRGVLTWNHVRAAPLSVAIERGCNQTTPAKFQFHDFPDSQ